MVIQGRERLTNVHKKQKLTGNLYQASPTVIKVVRLQQNNTSFVVNGKVRGRNSQMVVDSGTCFSRVMPTL